MCSVSQRFLEVTRFLVESGAGIIRMPCPELQALGLDWEARQGSLVNFEVENTRIWRWMKEKVRHADYMQISRQVVKEMDEYTRHGFQIVGP